ncbi:MAG: hypothetical protein HC770_00605 [Pseudanabaena sp. CRU_2_10]|nr:hypothetical protein [Pseudanabaena sp. CRU_2_10]
MKFQLNSVVFPSVISRYLNTMSGHAICSVGFVAVGAVVSFVCSLPRTFKTLSKLATVSTLFTFISVILAAIFAGIEDHPAGYNPDPNHVNEDGVKMGGNPLVLIFPMVGTTLVSGMNAYLNIGYTFMGQITLPSFIAEMKNPYDFRKALWLVTGAETVVFSLVGAGRNNFLATDPGQTMLTCAKWSTLTLAHSTPLRQPLDPLAMNFTRKFRSRSWCRH